MKRFFIIGVYVLLYHIPFVFAPSPSHAQNSNILPDNIVVAEEYESGVGAPIGKIMLTQGNSYIIHEDANTAYPAKADLPLYQNDTLITAEKARLRFILNDQSVMTLSGDTRLVINESIYNPEKETRFSLIKMLTGKARFGVKKMVDFKRSEFKVKTKTAICGVRGSDFIVDESEERTVITALDDTQLEIISLAQPDEEPVIVRDRYQVIFDEEGFISKNEVLPDEIEDLLLDFEIISTVSGPGESAQTMRQQTVSTEIDEMKSLETVEEYEIIISKDDLVSPDERIETSIPSQTVSAQVYSEQTIPSPEGEFFEKQLDVMQQQQENAIHYPAVTDLPSFPDTPK